MVCVKHEPDISVLINVSSPDWPEHGLIRAEIHCSRCHEIIAVGDDRWITDTLRRLALAVDVAGLSPEDVLDHMRRPVRPVRRRGGRRRKVIA